MNILESGVLTATVMFIFAASGISDVVLIRLYRLAQSAVADGHREGLLLALAAHPAKLTTLESVAGMIVFTLACTSIALIAFGTFAQLSRLLLRPAR
jgi:hypothetical protein